VRGRACGSSSRANLFAAQYDLLNGPTEHEFATARTKAEQIFERLEKELRGEYFGGDSLGLVDVAFAPALYRFVVVEHAFARGGPQLMAGFPKVDAWARRIADRKSVKDSVPQDFDEKFIASIHERHGWFERLVA
jgi:glutathione S-transferase